MPLQAMTVKQIEGLKPKPGQYEVAEKGGLRVRVYSSGVKAFIYRYKDAAGRQRVVRLGTVGDISLTEARGLVGDAKRDRERGIDPADKAAAAKKAQRQTYKQRAAAPTVADILDEYLTRHIEPHGRPQTAKEFRRLIDKHIKPHCGDERAEELTRSAVVAALDEIADAATPSIADHAGNVMRSAFRFGVARGRLEHNPCQALPRYAKQTRRERVLSPDEIKSLWAALDEHDGVTESIALALKLLLLTAQRRGSLAAATWTEFSDDKWEIPGEHSKTGAAHLVPLSPLAQEIVEQLRALTGKTDWVLPNPSLTRPITPRALTRALARLRGDADYTVHDLRRTAATLMAEGGTSRFMIARVLGHADDSMTGIYDRHEYQAEKRRAVETLARKVAAIVGKPETAAVVVPIRSKPAKVGA